MVYWLIFFLSLLGITKSYSGFPVMKSLTVIIPCSEFIVVVLFLHLLLRCWMLEELSAWLAQEKKLLW